jgi:hypothetical protein
MLSDPILVLGDMGYPSTDGCRVLPRIIRMIEIRLNIGHAHRGSWGLRGDRVAKQRARLNCNVFPISQDIVSLSSPPLRKLKQRIPSSDGPQFGLWMDKGLMQSPETEWWGR